MAYCNFYVEMQQAIEQIYQEDGFNEFMNFIANKKFNSPSVLIEDGTEELTIEAKEFIRQLAKAVGI